ncbi:MAG: two-component sensor histidine kinase [Rhodospirillum sp.]|nr:two-component sensor histidine kinase [Rhodospirillum sp.]MCF8490478.1 two-component sensor histidine kinase [Rhodospirillum sp.]MCF8502959.1 two-component sensor histidine kinase [Rhodospirillum sp.]
MGFDLGLAHQGGTSRRALIGLATVVLLAFNIAIAVNLVNQRDQTLQSARESVTTLVSAVREQTSATVSRVNVVLAGVAESLARQPGGHLWGDKESHALITSRLALLSTVRAIIVIDANGRLINDSTTPLPMILNLSDRDYFIAHARDGVEGLFIGRPVRGRSSGQWFLGMSRAILGPGGDFRGVVTAIVDPSTMGKAYEAMGLGNEGAITLYRADGTLLMRAPDYERFIGTFQGESPLFKSLILDNGKGVALDAQGIDGRKRLIAWSGLEDWPLVVTVSMDRKALLSRWEGQIPYHLTVMVVVSAVILALVLLVRRQITSLNSLVTDLSRRESDLIAANETIEVSSRAKTQFLANMSHELRTPLNAIIGFSDMLSAGIHGPLMGRQKEYVEDIHISALHLLELINDILDVAKIESGSYALHDQTLNLSEIVTATQRMMIGKAEEKRLELDSACVDPECWVLADERALRQIVLNLLSNAVKFTPHGGRVSLSVARNNDGGLTLTVEDTGIGIPQEHLDLVLRPFHQVDASDTRRHDGTGLGLPLAKALVEKHGGALRLESQLGLGTRVIVGFPARRVLTTGPSGPAEPERPSLNDPS